MLLNKTIRLFLDSIGRREEYEFYLKKFQSVETACFALLVPDFESLSQGAEAFAFDLHFLMSLGLRPAVILSGPDANEKWALLKGNPIFEKAQFPAMATCDDRVSVFTIRDVRSLEKMIPSLGKRIHFIRAGGGFDVDYYYTHKKNQMELSKDEKRLVTCAAALLESRPGTHISVTSPMNLLEEIFTVKGAGTVFRRGSTLLSENPDLARLRVLLEESFKKKPTPAVFKKVTQVYFEANYRGAVLLEEQPAGLYLSKFAVGPEARGEGIAQELWDEVCKNHPSFFWRSRIGNTINLWYDRQSDGHYTSKDWMIFWRGMPASSLSRLITFCEKRKPDFLS